MTDCTGWPVLSDSDDYDSHSRLCGLFEAKEAKFRSNVASSPNILNEPILMQTPFLQVVAVASIVALASLSGCASKREWSAVGMANTNSTHDLPDVSKNDSPSIRPVAYRNKNTGAKELSLLADQPTVNSTKQTAVPVPPAVVNSGPRTFDLESLVGMALSSNPAIDQAESAVAQASGIHCQVGLKPNPTVGYFGQEIGNDGAGGQHGVYASQTFVRGDKLQWNRCVASHDVNRLKWEVETQRRRVETDVRMRFYRVLAAQMKLRQAREFRDDAAKAVEVARQRLEALEGSKPDLLQSQLLVDQIDLSIRQSELEWQAAWSELAATIGQPSLQSSELSGDFISVESVDSEALYQQVISSSPQLSAAQARIDRARTNLQRQHNQAVPNLDVQLGFGIDDSSGDSFANVQLGMPILLHDRNQGNISAAHAEYVAACKNLQRLKLRLRRDLAEVYRRYQSSAVTVEKFEKSMLPRAEESLALVERARVAGEFNFLRVLTARQTLFDLQQQLIDARGKLSQADAEITGYLLKDALGKEVAFEGDDGLRGQALSGQ